MAKRAFPVRFRAAVVALLFLAHLLGYGLLGRRGAIEPFELFQLLLLAGNGCLALFLLKPGRDLWIGGGAMLLVAAHALLGNALAPDELTSGAILFVGLLTFYVGVQVFTRLPLRYGPAFAASYLALFVVFLLWMENAEALFLLFAMGLAACARSLRLLAYFWALTLSFTVCQPYAWESLFLSFFLLTALFGARGAARSPLALVFLGAGGALVLLVLLPVVIALFGENLQSLELVLRDPRVRRALWTTAVTATLSTAFLLVVSVPLAYAVSRLRFPGRTLFLSLIDIPIVIPQSVAGIALVGVFGGRQFLGEVLSRRFGVRFDGTLLGICLAQVFVAMPFLLKSAIGAFDAVSPGLEFAARTLGAPPWGVFARVAAPLASRGIFLGAVLAWARAAGEFGAVIFLAPTPETAPVLAFNRFQSVGVAETGPLVAVSLLFSLAMFFLLQFASRALPSPHGAQEGPP
ncbi:MAG: ABC transporter permease [Planctomycetota bacterium]